MDPYRPPLLRAPNGTLADTREFWMNGKALYDPGKITVTTLIVVGEWDRDTPPALARLMSEPTQGRFRKLDRDALHGAHDH